MVAVEEHFAVEGHDIGDDVGEEAAGESVFAGAEQRFDLARCAG